MTSWCFVLFKCSFGYSTHKKWSMGRWANGPLQLNRDLFHSSGLDSEVSCFNLLIYQQQWDPCRAPTLSSPSCRSLDPWVCCSVGPVGPSWCFNLWAPPWVRTVRPTCTRRGQAAVATCGFQRYISCCHYYYNRYTDFCCHSMKTRYSNYSWWIYIELCFDTDVAIIAIITISCSDLLCISHNPYH
jgi:hypothetical protein